MKQIDMATPLYTLVQTYPEVKDIMIEIGFKDIALPGMLQTAGRYMTIPKGAKMKKIAMDRIVALFEQHGFVCINWEEE